MYYHVVPKVRARYFCSFHYFAVTPDDASIDTGVCSHKRAAAYDNIMDVTALVQLDTFLQINARPRKRVPVSKITHEEVR